MCVGIGSTKTIAKKNHSLARVCNFTDEGERSRMIEKISLGETWGFGTASRAKLEAIGCATKGDVRDLGPRLARKGETVVGRRIVHELRGESGLDLETMAAMRKSYAVTRLFSRGVEVFIMEQAIATHPKRLGEKLRREGLGTDHVTVLSYDRARSERAPTQRLDNRDAAEGAVLVRAAASGARRVWRDGYRYSKAGLITVDRVPLAESQRALPVMNLGDREASASLMAALDTCNQRFGRGAVVPGAAGFALRRDWSTNFEMRSPRYTTRLEGLSVVQAAYTLRCQGGARREPRGGAKVYPVNPAEIASRAARSSAVRWAR